MRRFLPLLTFALLLVPSGLAKHSRKVRTIDSVTVRPSEAIEMRVNEEVAKAESILGQLDYGNLFDSPYLVSAVYYHDGYLRGYPSDRPDLDPAGRIVAKISEMLPGERKLEYIQLLRGLSQDRLVESGAPRLFLPVLDAESGRKRRRRQPHPYAVDLFVAEGTTVRSMSRGLVILAEADWRENDPFSTSSVRGGNSVIVFSPESGRFYRYCHLEDVTVAAGMAVEAGQPIGSVGHTGFNAARKGHGRHLHFEVNEFDGRTVRALNKNELLAILRDIANGNPAAGLVPGGGLRPLTSRTESLQRQITEATPRPE